MIEDPRFTSLLNTIDDMVEKATAEDLIPRAVFLSKNLYAIYQKHAKEIENEERYFKGLPSCTPTRYRAKGHHYVSVAESPAYVYTFDGIVIMNCDRVEIVAITGKVE